MKFRAVMHTKGEKTWYTLQEKFLCFWLTVQEYVEGDDMDEFSRGYFIDVRFEFIHDAQARAAEIAAETARAKAKVVSVALNEFEL